MSGSGVVLLPPAVAAVLGGPNEDDNSQGAERVKLLQRIGNATTVMVAVWSPRPAHYTLLKAHRSSTNDSWTLMYSGSLFSPTASGVLAAKRIAKRLGLWSGTTPWPPTTRKGSQQDGWSCGLWV